ncbi:MAG: hypothetical protein KAW12_13030 [Candidatus Aminicenantes bacterium]|nr:hypothetical protein [Candidatus Aminicenantes bacterium]
MIDKTKHVYAKPGEYKAAGAVPAPVVNTAFPGKRLKTKTGGEKFIVLNDLNDQHYKLKTPFRVKISIQDGELLGEIEELELYAFGESETGVLEELRSDLIDLYENFSQIDKENLGETPAKWKQILLTRIIETK